MNKFMVKPLLCYLCGGRITVKRLGVVRGDPRLDIIECLSCGLVFLSSFDHIHEDFYKDARMHDKLLGIATWLAETSTDDQRRFLFLKDLIKNKSVLDFGCGAGGFLMRAQDVTSSAVGVELEVRLKAHFREKGLKVFDDFSKVSGTFDVITVFHVLEHMKDPVDVLRRLSRKLRKNGSIIVEVPSADDALLKLYENKPFSQFTYWSCHLFLFTESTISSIAKKAGLKMNYIKQVQRYSVSNHLYWLAKGKPGGHKIWSFLDSKELHKSFEKQLASFGLCDTIIASFSKT